MCKLCTYQFECMGTKNSSFTDEQVSQNLCIMLHVDVDVTMLDDDINKSHVTTGDKLIVQLYKEQLTTVNKCTFTCYLHILISISCINIEAEKMEQEKKNV